MIVVAVVIAVTVAVLVIGVVTLGLVIGGRDRVSKIAPDSGTVKPARTRTGGW